jgi:hypothetical protein
VGFRGITMKYKTKIPRLIATILLALGVVIIDCSRLAAKREIHAKD